MHLQHLQIILVALDTKKNKIMTALTNTFTINIVVELVTY